MTIDAAVKWGTLAVRHTPAGGGAKLPEELATMCTPEQIGEGHRRADAWRRAPTGLTVMRIGKPVNPVKSIEFSWDPKG